MIFGFIEQLVARPRCSAWLNGCGVAWLVLEGGKVMDGLDGLL